MFERRAGLIIIIGAVATAIAFFAVLLLGPVQISFDEVFRILFGGSSDKRYLNTIVLQTRLPMAIAAACCGAMLSMAGLMMQTLFNNPLAGPSVMGISSGASLGVAVLMLSATGAGVFLNFKLLPLMTVGGALAGGLVTILILYVFSSVMKSSVTLLIVGIMISYLCSSAISLLNYFSPADEIRNYLIWGLGSFTGLRLTTAKWLFLLTVLSIVPSLFFVKPLNALLMGERYAESVGFNLKRIRGGILTATGLLVAIPTAFCGPIGFIGLIVPHLCRLLLKTSNILILMPATIVFGALVSLLCAIIGVLPAGKFGVLPINVITPIIGVPVILYLLIYRKRIPYFS